MCYNMVMNKLLKRGFNIYKILLKNKLAASLMMLVSGTMMAIAASGGHGNDTKTLPTLITSFGVLFSLWAFYRFGYLKADYDRLTDKAQRALAGRALFLQVLEALAYLIVTGAGIYLLMNESLVNLILNLIVGGFTIFNGIMGVVSLYKRRTERNWRWVVRLILTLVELAFGTYFIVSSSTIDTNGLLIMGILTAVAGLIETISIYSMETLQSTFKDGKEIVRILKDRKPPQDNGTPS